LSHLNNPEHWLDRAKEARAVAEDMIDPISKQRMLEVAATKRAEQRRTGKVLQRQDGA
jgi:DNA-directed RNA polymerase subunit K/omega